jgi:hypothetical protein
MKITKQIKIAGNKCQLISDQIKLEMHTPGRCVLTVKSDSKISKYQLIEIWAQMGVNELRPIFTGYVEQLTETQYGVYKIVGREMAAALNRAVNINLRHCTPATVLAEINKQTAIEFVLPNSEWVNQIVPRFQHIGGGYGALDYLLAAWQVSNGVWCQQSNGQVFVGESIKSVTGQKTITLNPSFFSSISALGGTLILVPRLRPGSKIILNDQKFYINSVDISGEEMRINWVVNPWDKNIRSVK